MQKLKEIIVLPIICVVVAFLLAFTYNQTKDIIDSQNASASDSAKTEVLVSADSFTEVDGSLIVDMGDLKSVTAYTADNGAGMAIEATFAGYASDITLMVGINADGAVEKVVVMDQTETPGIGDKILDEDFLALFEGSTISYSIKTEDDTTKIDAISSATESSKAMVKGMNSILSVFDQLKEVL